MSKPASSSASLDKRTRVMLTRLVANGELYAAHQKYRTTAARLLKTPAPSSFGSSASHHSNNAAAAADAPPALPYDDAAREAADLLYEGSRALLEKGELGGGTDLALYLLDTWRSRAVACDDTTRPKIQNLIALVGGGNAAKGGNWRKSIIDHASSWSASSPDTPAGDPALHAYIGQVLHKDREFYGAEQHYLAAQTRDAAKSLARLLFEWFKLDPSSTTTHSTLGRYAARGVLSYLESYAISAALVFLDSFLKLATNANPSLLLDRIALTTWQEKSSSSSSTTGEEQEVLITKLASLNFLQLAIKTCQVGVSEQVVRRTNPNGKGTPSAQTVYPGKQGWISLLQRYEREVPWLREPEVKESTAILGEIYFGIKPANTGGANILGDLMSSLFGGGGGGASSGSSAAAKGKGRGKAPTPQIGPAGLD